MSLTKEERPSLGSISEPFNATMEQQALLAKIKPHVEKAAKTTFQTFETHLCCTQIVSGVMYFFKVHIGGEKYIHVKALKTLPIDADGVEFKGYQDNKTKDDRIIYF
ncbi:Leukocyte cysteine proteinase inhibitor 1 [Apostichopus japonicus]|uniref:Leukocyte cysteine proteinase inhibitor 1 n=1 Tax=Stichopus japonicus TaxID=307972 RepID=A0A2G8KJL1_STIJA|nr:Leukocyte cysteine proteinase inhibitor 1 [Apostichopus japonicus]